MGKLGCVTRRRGPSITGLLPLPCPFVLSGFPIRPAIPVSDMDRAVKFYGDTLRFSQSRSQLATGEVLFESGGIVFFLYESEFAGTNRATVAAWPVADLEAIMGELRAAGVKFLDFDEVDFKTVDGIFEAENGSKAAWFMDSEGNTLALGQLAT